MVAIAFEQRYLPRLAGLYAISAVLFPHHLNLPIVQCRGKSCQIAERLPAWVDAKRRSQRFVHLPDLRWLGNVGAVFDGHRKYYGIYAGDASIFYSTLGGFKPEAGRPTGSGKGYQRKYLFRLDQPLRQAAERVVPLPKQRGMRSAWLRLFILKGAEALAQGYLSAEGKASWYTKGADRGKVEGLRVTGKEEAQIEQWREGRNNSALMRRLFVIGVVYLETVDRDEFLCPI